MDLFKPYAEILAFCSTGHPVSINSLIAINTIAQVCIRCKPKSRPPDGGSSWFVLVLPMCKFRTKRLSEHFRYSFSFLISTFAHHHNENKAVGANIAP
jgi:hypothetical protein